jgi:hypothetical protein
VLFSIYNFIPFAAHLGKREAFDLPMVKYVVKPLHFILVGRDKKDSKDAREKLWVMFMYEKIHSLKIVNPHFLRIFTAHP